MRSVFFSFIALTLFLAGISVEARKGPTTCFVDSLVGRTSFLGGEKVIGYATRPNGDRFVRLKLGASGNSLRNPLLDLLQDSRGKKLYEQFGMRWIPEEGVFEIPDPATYNRIANEVYGDIPHFEAARTRTLLSRDLFPRVFAHGRFPISVEYFFHDVIDHMGAWVLVRGKSVQVVQSRAQFWDRMARIVKERDVPQEFKTLIQDRLSDLRQELEGSAGIGLVIRRNLLDVKKPNSKKMKKELEEQIKNLVRYNPRSRSAGAANELEELQRSGIKDFRRFGFETRREAEEFFQNLPSELNMEFPEVSLQEIQSLVDEIVEPLTVR